MKTKILTALFLCLFLCCSIHSQQKEILSPIQKIIVSNGILLTLERSPDYTISLNMQDINPTCLIKTVENGVLTLKLVNSMECRGKVSVNISCPTLRELEIMGNADVSTRNVFTGDSLKLTMKSGGKAYLDLDIRSLNANLIEGSLLSATGYAVRQYVYVSSNATYSAFDLDGDNVTVESTLGGKAKVCASKELKASTKTGGYIGYKCNPASKILEPKGNGVIQLVTEDE